MPLNAGIQSKCHGIERMAVYNATYYTTYTHTEFDLSPNNNNNDNNNTLNMCESSRANGIKTKLIEFKTSSSI